MPPNRPPARLAKGRLIVRRGERPRYALPFQYNPETVSRSLTLQAGTGDEGGRSKAPVFGGAAKGTISLAARLEAIPGTGSDGILPQMAAIELLLYPTSDDVTAMDATLDAGKRAVAGWPMPSITLELGSRAVPVSLTSVGVEEQEYDIALTPIRATLTLSFTIVTYSSVDDEDVRAQQFLEHQKYLETLASSAQRPLGR